MYLINRRKGDHSYVTSHKSLRYISTLDEKRKSKLIKLRDDSELKETSSLSKKYLIDDILTCCCVNNTRRFRLCANGNCIGFESPTLHAAKLPILPIWPMEPPAELPINLETVERKKNENKSVISFTS